MSDLADPESSSSAPSLIDLTRKIAGAILQRAGQEAESIRREAAERGYREGLEEARRQGVIERESVRRELLSQVGERLLKLEREFDENWNQLQQIVEGNLLETVLHLAGNSLGKLLQENPEALAQAVKEALPTLDARQKVSLRVHPDDLEGIVGLSELPWLSRCELQPDDNIERGGFVASAENGEIDGQWSARVAFWKDQMAQGA